MRFYHLSQRHIFWGAIILVATAVVTVMMVGGGSTSPSQQNSNDSLQNMATISSEHVAANLQQAPDVTKNTVASAETTVSKKQENLSNKSLQLWGPADLNDPSPSIKLNERVVDYQSMRVAMREGNIPVVGQQVTLPMLHDEKITVKVEAVETLSNGDVSWSGHLAVDGDTYPVVMTLGERSSFATITTPKGSYSLESQDGSGWLYKNPAEVELSNFGANDYLEVNNP